MAASLYSESAPLRRLGGTQIGFRLADNSQSVQISFMKMKRSILSIFKLRSSMVLHDDL